MASHDTIQLFLKDCKQTKDEFWPILSPFTMENSEFSTRELMERIQRLEEKYAIMNSRIQFMESNWRRDGPNPQNDEEKIKFLRLLLRAESLVQNLSQENRTLKMQLEAEKTKNQVPEERLPSKPGPGSSPVSTRGVARTSDTTGRPTSPFNQPQPQPQPQPQSTPQPQIQPQAQVPPLLQTLNSQNNQTIGSVLEVPPTNFRRSNSAPPGQQPGVVQRKFQKDNRRVVIQTVNEDASELNGEESLPLSTQPIQPTQPKHNNANPIPSPSAPIPSTVPSTVDAKSLNPPILSITPPIESNPQPPSSITPTVPPVTTLNSTPAVSTPTATVPPLPSFSTPPSSNAPMPFSPKVNYPVGYDPLKRRYSVSSESFTPEQFRDVKLKIIPKPEEVKQRIRVTVRGNVLFKHLDDAELNEVVDAMEEIEFQKSTIVIKQGALIDENNMYLVNKGELEVLYGEEVVATLTNGAAFGEIALMYGCPRTATVRTRTACSLWVLDRNTFRRILMEESMRRRKLYESVLSKVPIFKGLLPYERSKIADALEGVHFKDKDVIITQGSTDTDKFYIIEKGEVVCTKKSTDGKSEVEALRLKAGDYFGELALLKNEPRQATVIASGQVKCLTIGREHFNQVMGPCEDLLRRNMGSYKSYEELVSSLTSSKSASHHTDLFGQIAISDLPETYNEILKYIIRNDSDYLFNLNQTEGFYNALTEHAESLNITPEQINTIFSNFKDILAFQKKFNAFLLGLCEGYNADLSDLAELYTSQASSFSVYEPFVSSYKESLKTRKECARNTLFSDFLMECHKWAGESIDTYLEFIYTRVPKIALMLSQLLEATAPSHPDKNLLAIAVRKIDHIVDNMKNLDNNNQANQEPKT